MLTKITPETIDEIIARVRAQRARACSAHRKEYLEWKIEFLTEVAAKQNADNEEQS